MIQRTALCLDCGRCNLIGSQAHTTYWYSGSLVYVDSIPTVELKIHEWKYPSHLSWERAPGGSSDVQSPRNGGKRRGVWRQGAPRRTRGMKRASTLPRVFPPFFYVTEGWWNSSRRRAHAYRFYTHIHTHMRARIYIYVYMRMER